MGQERLRLDLALKNKHFMAKVISHHQYLKGGNWPSTAHCKTPFLGSASWHQPPITTVT